MMPVGASLYLYGFGTGGGAPSSKFANGPYASVTNTFGVGNIVAALAASNKSSNSFTTSTQYQVTGGVAISGSSTFTASNATNPNSGASFVSDTFTVTYPNNLVVVIAIAGDGQGITLGGNASLQSYISSPSNGRVAMTIANTTTLAPSGYYVTETTQPVAGEESRAGDIIGVWVFKPPQFIRPSPTLPLPTLIFNWQCFTICLAHGMCFPMCWP